MRSRLVDLYIKSVLNDHKQLKREDFIQVIEEIYRLNLDNRILNNLRMQLNEMIEDEKGLVSVEVFKKMFFTYFKGEKKAFMIFDMLLPLIQVAYDEAQDKVCEDGPNVKHMIQIQKLTQFIDFFNYYPVNVPTIRHKNDSNELTFVLSANQYGSRNDRGEFVIRRGAEKNKYSSHIQELL